MVYFCLIKSAGWFPFTQKTLEYDMSRKNLQVVANVLRTPKLRNVLFGCLLIAILLPTYSTYYVMPLFSNLLMENTENEAGRTAAHLKTSFLRNAPNTPGDLLHNTRIEEINQTIQDFGIKKLKIFSSSGAIIYSTEKAEIGEINNHSYFLNVVAKGNVYSKIVKKNQTTAEGNVFKRDVAEVYVPIMDGAAFEGALEIYYDITESKQGLDKILTQSSRILYSLSCLLFVFVLIMIFKASESMVKMLLAEKKIQEVNNLLESKVFAQTAEIKVTQKTSIEALAILAENYDHDTGCHLARIQEYVGLLLRQLELSSSYAPYIRKKPNYVMNIQLASILHDIGKVAVDRNVLLKPARLTPEEFEKVKTHTVIAGEVLAKANNVFVDEFGKDSYLALARDIALFHHEKWDGRGYPYGLAGEDIPLSARVVALADVYDALRSTRPYKKARSHAFSVAEICRDKGTHFDPIVVEAFLVQADKFDAVAESFYKSGFVESFSVSPDTPTMTVGP